MRRRALATSELIAVVAAAFLVVGASVVVTPRIIRGDSDISQRSDSHAPLPLELQNALNAMSVLLSESHATLATVPSPGDSAEIEFIALWMSDEHELDRVNFSELVILRHSRLLRSVSAYAWEAQLASDHDQSIAPAQFNADFIDRMMRDASTTSSVIGVNVDWRVLEPERSEKSSPAADTGRIELTWSSHSADSETVARVPTGLPPRVATR